MSVQQQTKEIIKVITLVLCLTYVILVLTNKETKQEQSDLTPENWKGNSMDATNRVLLQQMLRYIQEFAMPYVKKDEAHLLKVQGDLYWIIYLDRETDTNRTACIEEIPMEDYPMALRYQGRELIENIPTDKVLSYFCYTFDTKNYDIEGFESGYAHEGMERSLLVRVLRSLVGFLEGLLYRFKSLIGLIDNEPSYNPGASLSLEHLYQQTPIHAKSRVIYLSSFIKDSLMPLVETGKTTWLTWGVDLMWFLHCTEDEFFRTTCIKEIESQQFDKVSKIYFEDPDKNLFESIPKSILLASFCHTVPRE